MNLHTVTAWASALSQATAVPGWILLLIGLLFAGAGVITAILLIRKNRK